MKHKTRTIITTEIDEAALRDLCAAYPFLSPHRAAQLALRYGLRCLRADPDLLVEAAREERG